MRHIRFGFLIAYILGKTSAKTNIKEVITKVEYKIPIDPKDFIRIFVAKAEERIFTKLLPNNIALIIISFFFNSF